jgi:flagellar protein FlaJ
MKVPFSPFPSKVMDKVSRRFERVGSFLEKFFPKMEGKLDQAELKIKPKYYLTMGAFTTFFWFVFLNFLLFFFAFLTDDMSVYTDLFLYTFLASAFIFISVIYYPTMQVNKKIKDFDRNLPFAIRHLLVQVKSGVPLFQGLVSISEGNYGSISTEFKRAVKNISTGMSEPDALEKLAYQNPSLYFRRSIWQIINTFKSGANLSETLESMVKNLTNEQKVLIRKYGSQLNPMAMMYMMIAVIIPSLGITFMIIMSSFSGFPITEVIFWSILGFVAFFQFMFVGFIKNRRPPVEI